MAIATPAPAFAAIDGAGELHTLGGLLADGGPLVLAFLDPAAGDRPQIEAALSRAAADGLQVVRVVTGDATPEPGMLRLVDRGVADAYSVAGAPSAVVIDGDGWIASGLAVGASAITALLSRAPGTAPLIELLDA